MKKKSLQDDFIQVSLRETVARLNKVPAKTGSYLRVGKYSLFIDVTALNETVYIPVSIASGRKSTGFIYHIEGTHAERGSASIDCRGEGVSMITAGTLTYAKIPKGKTASFKILADIEGKRTEKYVVVVSRINYKLNTNDARYKRFVTDIRTGSLQF
jgi:hypothetical protein